jgi:hypothetical protein
MRRYKSGSFDIEHPILSILLNIIVWLGLIIVAFIIGVILIILIMLPFNNCYEGSKIFEYEDLNGNIGTASNCQYTDKENRSGGMGEPICFVGAKVIAVKWYEDKTQYGSCKEMMFGGK